MFQEKDRVDEILYGAGVVLAVDYSEDDLSIYVRFERITSLGRKFWMRPSELVNLEWTQSAEQSSN